MTLHTATAEPLGPFSLKTRTITDEQGQGWLEAELTLTSGRLRVELDQQDGNAHARARGHAIDAALHMLDRMLAEAIAGRQPDDEDEGG